MDAENVEKPNILENFGRSASGADSAPADIPPYEPYFWNDLERVRGPIETDPFFERIDPLSATAQANTDAYKVFLEEHYPEMFESQGSGIYFYYSDQAHQIAEFPVNELAELWRMPEQRVKEFINDFNSFWGGIQTSTNCYTYAVNDKRPLRGGKINPGESSGFKPDEDMSYTEKLVAGAVYDGLESAGKAMPPEKSGHYRVALYVMEDDASGANDYHWLRENPDGAWSGKFGPAEVSNLDLSGNVITDPETAMMTNVLGQEYKLAGFFYVKSPGIDLYPEASVDAPSYKSHKDISILQP